MKTPRYEEWSALGRNGQWSSGVPDWARDHAGQMNDMVAARAVIAELAAQLKAAKAVVDAAESVFARLHTAEWERGARFKISFVNPNTRKDEPNAAAIPVRILRELSGAVQNLNDPRPLKEGEPVYHTGRREYCVFIRYDEQRSSVNNTCWVCCDGEDVHVSVERVVRV